MIPRINMRRGLLLTLLFCIFAASFVSAQPAGKIERSEVKPLLGSTMRFRMMTYNIRHARGEDGKVDLDRIAGDISKAGADIIALQEVDRRLPRSGMQDQVKRLARMLGMYSCYSPSLDFKIGQYGIAILSRYPIEEHEVRYLASPIERRSLLKAVIKIGDQRVTVFNTHLGLNQEERKKQMAVIAAALQEVEGPAVLVGDLNMRPGNSILADIPSSFHHVRLPLHTSTLHVGGEIDYIYTNFPDPDATAWTQPTEGSDHDPVLADLPLS